MTTLAFKATYSDWKLIKTRGVVQVVMEVPLSEADAAYQILGGMPDFSQERWFGVAPLKPEREVMPNPQQQSILDAQPQPDKDKHSAGAKRMDWRDLQPAAQAGIRCADPVFDRFIREEHLAAFATCDQDCAKTVRFICGVKSRSELGTNHAARMIWKQLDDQFYAWQRVVA